MLTVFVFDRLSFWRVRPGQLTREYALGAVENSYDTDNMVFTKRQDYLFRHWILGVAGDLEMQTMGGRGVVAKGVERPELEGVQDPKLDRDEARCAAASVR